MIDELFGVIEARKLERPADSYTVKLFDAGVSEIARKVGEESLEVIVAALSESDERLIEECADLMYHTLVLLSSRDLTLEQVYTMMRQRRSPGEK